MERSSIRAKTIVHSSCERWRRRPLRARAQVTCVGHVHSSCERRKRPTASAESTCASHVRRSRANAPLELDDRVQRVARRVGSELEQDRLPDKERPR